MILFLKKATVLVAIVLSMSCCVALGQSGSDAAQEFLAAGKLASSALSTAESTDSTKAAWDRLAALYQYRNSGIQDGEISQDWNAIEQDANTCLYDLSLIFLIDKEKPDNLDLFEKIVRENKTQQQQQDRDDTFAWRIFAEIGKIGMESSFRDDEAKLDNAVASLVQVGNRVAKYQDSNLLSVAYLPAWQGSYDNDLLEIKNQSASTIQDALLFVTVHDSGGGVRLHVHSIASLGGNQVLDLKYPWGHGDYTESEAVRWPTRADVILFRPAADSIAVSTASSVLDDEAMSSIVSNYLNDVKLHIRPLGPYTEDQTNKYFGPGVEFDFNGIQSLPVKEVVVSLWNASGERNDVRWTIDPGNKLDSNTNYSYRSGYFSQGSGALSPGEAPSHVAVTLGFYGTNFEKTWRQY